jgi:molybdate transport system ATP-binding protein
MPAPPAPTPSEALIRLDKVTLRVGQRRILAGTSWTIRAGENWVVLGPNGSGKTSLTAALTGEVPVVAGRRRLNRDLLREADMARLSFESQRRLMARDEARDEARGFAGLAEEGQTARALLQASTAAVDAVDAAAARLALGPVLDQPLRSLSTGEMRRLLLARGLLRNPRLLILDEPFDGLDAAMRQRLADIIAGLMAEGLQLVLVTHREEEILSGMTHYLVLGDDRVREQGRFSAARRRQAPSAGPLSVPARASSPTAGGAQRLPDRDTAALIRMAEVSVAYGERRVLNRLNWCVRPGEHWLVSGPNGAGKSTLLRLVSADHLQAYANRIELFGRRRGSGESIWEIKQRMGVVSSEFQVRYRKSVSGYAVVLSGFFDSVGLYHQASREQREQALAWIGRLHLQELSEVSFDRLSSGQQRMLLIARAVVKDPDLLILDEPCQGLDAANRRRVLAMVDHIGIRTTTQLIVTTHHADERPACMTHELRLFPGGKWDTRRLPH